MPGLETMDFAIPSTASIKTIKFALFPLNQVPWGDGESPNGFMHMQQVTLQERNTELGEIHYFYSKQLANLLFIPEGSIPRKNINNILVLF